MRGRGAAAPGTVEPDKSSLWMDLFSLDSGEDTDPPYKVHAFGSRDNAPHLVTKKPSYGPSYLA